MENLELLGELRKKQDMLGQKRNEFRRQLDKLAKLVAALRDHFSLFGQISDVEIEELGEGHCQNAPNDFEVMRNCSARVSFATRHSAERAFVNENSWHGHNLHFLWATPSIPCCSRTSGRAFPPLKVPCMLIFSPPIKQHEQILSKHQVILQKVFHLVRNP